jgi:hypothetical protein
LEPSLSTEDWKSEYDTQVEAWRAQSAAARTKAEKERERWEAVRASQILEESQNPNLQSEEHSEAEWESISHHRPSQQVSGIPSPSPVDARDLVPGEPNRQVRISNLIVIIIQFSYIASTAKLF